jgi:hypothetical protein
MVALIIQVPGASFRAQVRSLLRYHKKYGLEFAARLGERPLSQRGKLPWQCQELFDALDGRLSSRDTGIRWNLVAAGYIRPKLGLEQYLWNLRRYRILSCPFT